EVLERSGDVAEVRGRAQHIGIGVEHILGAGLQGGADRDLDVAELRQSQPGQGRLGDPGGRIGGGMMDEQHVDHGPSLAAGMTRVSPHDYGGTMAVIFDPLRGRVRPVASHPDETIIDVLTDRYTASDWAVLTGAGMSTDSGVPDYRGPDAAPRSPMTIQTFLSHPDQRARYWARSWIGWPRMRSTRPNPGHLGLAGLDVAGIVTQNVDGLHQAAAKERSSHPGAPAPSPVIDLHGSLDRVICLDNGHLIDRDWVQRRLSELNPDFAHEVGIDPIDVETAPDGALALEATAGFIVADCPERGGPLIGRHGSLVRVICLYNGHLIDRDWVQRRLSDLTPYFAHEVGIDPIDVETAPDGDVELEYTAGFIVADCPECGGMLKPDVVY